MTHPSTGIRGHDGSAHSSRTSRGLVAVLACATVGGLTFATAAPSATASPSTDGRAVTTTDFALQAAAYGTQSTDSDLQATSGRTALIALSCTRQAGIDRSRGAEASDLNGFGSAEGVHTRVWTTSAGGVVTSHASSRVDSLGIGNAEASFGLSQLLVTTRTWHDSQGFHRKHTFDVGGLTGEAGGTELPGLPAPDEIEPGQTFEIPGLVTLTFDIRTGAVTSSGASAMSTGLTMDFVDGSHSVASVAKSELGGHVAGGILGGKAESAYSGEGLLAARNVVKKSVPCVGTDGKWTNAAGGDIDQDGLQSGDATVGALGAQQGPDQAVSRTRAETDRVSLGGGQVVIRNIKSQANVERDGGTYLRTADGSSVGRLVVNGEPQAIPAPGEKLTIPGVATIIPQVVTKRAHSITVVGLRIRMLDGTEVTTVYDIAKSFAVIEPR